MTIIKNMSRLALVMGFSAGSAVAEQTIVPDPHVPFPEEKTVVWSPLFQATWDTMNREMGGRPRRIDPPNELMTRLDTFEWKPETVMPEDSWKTWAGRATADFVKRVNAEAVQMTGEKQGPFTLGNLQPTDLACFGLLDRDVEFVVPFHRSKKFPLSFGKKGKPVQFFGARGDLSDAHASSVKVLLYRPETKTHAVEILCKEADDRVILYLPETPQNFAAACITIKELRKNHGEDKKRNYGALDDPWLHSGDDLRIPYVDLEVVSEMKEQLKSGRYYEVPEDPWTIVRAEQKTKFKLHEKGARVRVEASIGLEPFGGPPPTVPRDFIYDRPFFVFLWRDQAEWPYLGVWVGDISAMKTMNAAR